jgi:hypothetical protein
MSAQLLVTTIIMVITFLIDSSVMFLVLLRGRQKHHYLFAAALALFAIGALCMSLIWIRNSHPDELIIYLSVNVATLFLSIPCIYHFTCLYLNQPRRKSTVFIWTYSAIIVSFNLYSMLIAKNTVRVIQTDWGNLVQSYADPMDRVLSLIVMVSVYAFVWSACWFLFRARRRETSTLARRHMLYIFISLLAISFFSLTLFLPLELGGNLWLHIIRGLAGAAFGAIIGVAIIKERLFDITVIIKRTTLYSIFLAIIVFVFSLSEHLLASYVGEFFGEHSIFIHIISIAVVIAVLMPIRQRIERAIERLFAKKTVEF